MCCNFLGYIIVVVVVIVVIIIIVVVVVVIVAVVVVVQGFMGPPGRKGNPGIEGPPVSLEVCHFRSCDNHVACY